LSIEVEGAEPPEGLARLKTSTNFQCHFNIETPEQTMNAFINVFEMINIITKRSKM